MQLIYQYFFSVWQHYSLVYLFFIEKDVNHLFDVRGVALTTTNKK
jgi:hypothetical protein